MLFILTLTGFAITAPPVPQTTATQSAPSSGMPVGNVVCQLCNDNRPPPEFKML
jgi:hypothetical protein